jgi:hypothetical protein
MNLWLTRPGLRIGVLLERYQRVSRLSLLVMAFAVCTLAVAASLAERWEGARTCEAAFIPLRPLRVPEAEALLSLAASEHAPHLGAVVGLSERVVTIATSSYLLPLSEQDCKGRPVSYRGQKYVLNAASWAHYHNKHRIDRAALQAQLGRALLPGDIDRSTFARSESSFSSADVWLYVVIEVVVLTTLLFVILLAPQHLPQHGASLLLWPGILFLAWVALWMFGESYAPALRDADWFYQRILVERILVVGDKALSNPMCSGAAFISVIGLALHRRFVLGTQLRIIRFSAPPFWRAVSAFAVGGCLVILGAEYRSFVRSQRVARAQLIKASERWRIETLARLKDDPDLRRRTDARTNLFEILPPDHAVLKAAKAVLADIRTSGREELRWYVPMSTSEFIALRLAYYGPYLDVRRLEYDNGARESDYEAVVGILNDGGAWHASFMAFVLGPLLEGVAVGDGDQVSVVLFRSDGESVISSISH